MKERKKYEDLLFSDDFMFCKVMTANKELCIGFLERILSKKILDIVYLNSQENLRPLYDAKTVCLDVYVEDSEDKVYNIEMQASHFDNLVLRSRYYQSTIDVNLLERGAGYDKLSKSYIIFVCTQDIFGLGLPIYTFTNRCHEAVGLELDDRVTKVVANVSGDLNALPEDTAALFRYIRDNVATDDYTGRIDVLIDEAKAHQKWRTEYMVWEAKIWDERKEAREEGRAEGLAEGLETGRAEGLATGRAEGLASGISVGQTQGIEYSAKRLLASGMSAEEVARILELEVEKVRGML